VLIESGQVLAEVRFVFVFDERPLPSSCVDLFDLGIESMTGFKLFKKFASCRFS